MRTGYSQRAMQVIMYLYMYIYRLVYVYYMHNVTEMAGSNTLPAFGASYDAAFFEFW